METEVSRSAREDREELTTAAVCIGTAGNTSQAQGERDATAVAPATAGAPAAVVAQTAAAPHPGWNIAPTLAAPSHPPPVDAAAPGLTSPSPPRPTAPKEEPARRARALPTPPATGSGREPSGAGCAAPAVPVSRPSYLAAGVLPFCVLGGDLLFLLGQELRFRSRVRRLSLSEMHETATSSGGGGGGGSNAGGGDGGTSESGAEPIMASSFESAPIRRPRRAPRPKLSPLLAVPLRSGALPEGQAHVETSPSLPLASRPQQSSPKSRASCPSTFLPSAQEVVGGDTVPPPPFSAENIAAGDRDARSGILTSSCQQPLQVEKVQRAGANVTAAAVAVEAAGESFKVTKGAVAVAAVAGQHVGEEPDRTKIHRSQDSPSGVHPDGRTARAATDGGQSLRDHSSATATATRAPGLAEASKGRPDRRSPIPEEPMVAREQGGVPAGLLWSDFGGGREAGDADAEETASREFAEESFGMFHGVRLESDSVARSQASMACALRDPTLRGKRVFECRNGGYVMFIAEVDFVPDLMMKLARKEIVDGRGEGGGSVGSGSGGDFAGDDSTPGFSCSGGVSSPGFSEKTDFAWVPASSLLGAMRESRNRSTRKVVVKLGGCRYLRLFHKFVISLWGLDLAGVIKAASTPLRRQKCPLPAPRVLLLKPSGGGGGSPVERKRTRVNGGGGESESSSSSDHDERREGGSRRAERDLTYQVGAGRCAIRGIDCIRPSFLSGRKRTSLGIIDERCDRRGSFTRRVVDDGGGRNAGDGGGGDAAAYGFGSGDDDAADVEVGSDGCETLANVKVYSCRGGTDGGRNRGKKSGAACRKKRRQCKEARRLKAAAAASAASAAVRSSAATTTAVSSADVPSAPGKIREREARANAETLAGIDTKS